MPKTGLTTLIVLLLLCLASCKETPDNQKMKEGSVEYHINYLGSDAGNLLIQHMPDKMVMKFKNQFSVNQIEGFFGFFELNNVSDLKKGTNTTMLKVLDKKYYYLGEPDEQACCFDAMENMKIRYMDETKTICGLECHKAQIIFPKDASPSFFVYYTDEIEVDKPNRTNPFHKIDGVLMEFELKLRDMRMRLEAVNISSKNIPDKDFSIQEGYQRISKEDMEEIVDKLMK